MGDFGRKIDARIKEFEATGTSQKIDPSRPVCARINGRLFGKLLEGRPKPFDDEFSAAMRAACVYAMSQSKAVFGFVHSDEISLVWPAPESSFIALGHRLQKVNSLLASLVSVKFYSLFPDETLPAFDCRIWQVPNQKDVAETILWRAWNAGHNSLFAACRAQYSADELDGVDRAKQLEMLAEKGIVYDQSYSEKDRHGTFFRRSISNRYRDDAEWAEIPISKRPASRLVPCWSVVEVANPRVGNIADMEAFIFNPQTGHLT